MYIDDNKWKELMATLEERYSESQASYEQAGKLGRVREEMRHDGQKEAYNDALALIKEAVSPPIQEDDIKVLEVKKDPTQGLLVSMLCNGLEIVVGPNVTGLPGSPWLMVGEYIFWADEWTPTMKKCVQVYYAEREKEQIAWGNGKVEILQRLP